MNYRAKGHDVADTLKRRDGLLSLECVALNVNRVSIVDSGVQSLGWKNGFTLSLLTYRRVRLNVKSNSFEKVSFKQKTQRSAIMINRVANDCRKVVC